MNEIIGYIFLAIGVMFNLFGCIGLHRLPDVYTRLQAAAKCATLGTCGMLLGVLMINGFGATGSKALLAMVFVLLTSPTAAQALSKAAYKSGIIAWKKNDQGETKEEAELREAP